MSTSAEKKKLSKTPSWIMVGFVLGVLAVLGFQADGDEEQEEKPVATTPAAPVPPPHNVTALENRPSLAAIEAVFAKFRELALWEDDVTEVALWNTASNAFTDHFEVFRAESGAIFFRSIPAFTRLPLENYGPPNCPLRFTETASMRALRENRTPGVPPLPSEPLQFPTPTPPEPNRERP